MVLKTGHKVINNNTDLQYDLLG